MAAIDFTELFTEITDFVGANHDIVFQESDPNLIYVLMFHEKGVADIYHYIITKVA